MEIDHLFICTEQPIEMGKILTDFGLTEGEPNKHIGQGTANRRFFFQNFYLELLFLENEERVKSPLTSPTKFYERLTSKTQEISPFGVCFRPKNSVMVIDNYITWEYKPLSFPDPFKIDVIKAPLHDPMFQFMGFLSESSKQIHVRYKHAHNLTILTQAIFHTPYAQLDTDIKRDLDAQNVIKFKPSETHILELEFDGGSQGITHDFRPKLPLLIKY